MKHSEVGDLLTMCAGFDNRTVGEANVVAWHQIIGHLPYVQAKIAVLEYYTRESRQMMPADVMAGVKRIRRDALESADATFVYTGDPDDTGEWKRQLLAHRTAIGDGEVIVPPAIENPVNPQKAIEGLANEKKMPRKRSA